MRFEDYTPSQQKAIITKGTNIIVSAGAGSGKTQVLTERVVHFVKNEKYHLSDFLILTFTNLAAAEMKNRIRKSLIEEGLEEANQVDFADISTFDAFALSLVKKHHFLLNVSPNVSIIDSNIIDVRKRRIIEQLFEEEYVRCTSNFKTMIELFCFKDDDNLRKLLLTFYNKAILELDTEQFINNFITHYYSQEIIESFKSEVLTLFNGKKDEIIKLVYQLPNVKLIAKSDKTLLNVYEAYIQPLLQAKTYNGFINALLEDVPDVRLTKGNKDVGLIKKNLNEQIKSFQEVLKKYPSNEEDFGAYFNSCRPFAEKLIEMLIKLDGRLNAFKIKHQVFEFQDIAKMALNLVKNHPQIQEDIKQSYQMIMIDEYQDTSLLQEAFIQCIQRDNVYMVGDVKQSIYRFRNARCDIFADKYRKYKAHDGGISIDLNTNFRSRKEVLDDINYIFKQLMSERYGEADYPKEHTIEYGNKDYIKAGATQHENHLEALVYEPVKSSEVSQIESVLIARDIIEKINHKYLVMDYVKDSSGIKKPILRPCQFSDFCILMDRGGAFDVYAQTFNEYQLPLHIENDEDISNNDVILILTNLLRLIKSIQVTDYQSKEFLKSYLSVARSFLFEYTDEQLLEACQKANFDSDPIIVKLKKIVNQFSYLSLSNLFDKVLFEFDILHKSILIGNVAKVEQYLNTFANMFKTMSTLDYSIDDFILFMECIDDYNLQITLSSSGSTADSIKIMNIHKSKGLEFNIVYYSGLKKEFNRMDLKEEFGISIKHGVILPPNDPLEVNILKELKANDEIEHDISEKIRLFYVALTRTREKMICLIQSEEYEASYRELYQKQFDEYRNNHHLKEMDKDKAFEIIYDDFRDKTISGTLFNMLIEEIEFDLPFPFLELELEEQLTITKEQIIEWIHQSKDYIERVKSYARQLLETNSSRPQAVLSLFKEYVAGSINYDFFIHTVITMDCEIDDAFTQQFKWDENDQDITERSTLTLDLKQIHINQMDTLSPVTDQNCMHLDCVSTLLDLIENGVIDVPMFVQYCKILEVNIKPEVLDSLSNKFYIPQEFHTSDLLQNPVFDYDKQEAKRRFLSRLEEEVKTKIITNEDALFLLYVYFYEIPYHKEISLAITKLSKHEIDLETLQEAIAYVGYTIKPETLTFFLDVFNGVKGDDEIAKFNTEPFKSHFELTSEVMKTLASKEAFTCENILKKLYLLYQSNIISLDKFIALISCFNFELTKEFSILRDDEKKTLDSSKMDEIIVEKGQILSNVSTVKSFYGFVTPFIKYRKFKHYAIDRSTKIPKLITAANEKEYEKLTINETNIKFERLNPYRPSKSIDIGVSKDALELGKKLHLAMEVTNFKDPDYSLLTNDLIEYVKAFIESPLCQNIKDGTIYKEYDFFDEVENIQGVIDLFVVYDHHIDIIDYKTKLIDDHSYDKQLNLYRSYIKRKFDKPVYMYLYSIMDGMYREVS